MMKMTIIWQLIVIGKRSPYPIVVIVTWDRDRQVNEQCSKPCTCTQTPLGSWEGNEDGMRAHVQIPILPTHWQQRRVCWQVQENALIASAYLPGLLLLILLQLIEWLLFLASSHHTQLLKLWPEINNVVDSWITCSFDTTTCDKNLWFYEFSKNLVFWYPVMKILIQMIIWRNDQSVRTV
jgi:hypothetical protein